MVMFAGAIGSRPMARLHKHLAGMRADIAGAFRNETMSIS